MRRIGLSVVLAVSLFGPPLTAVAQSLAKVPRVGYLSPVSAGAPGYSILRQSLRELGYVEGQNIAFQESFAEGYSDRMPALAAELVRQHVDVIVAASRPAIRAAKEATKAIPIVMITGDDPVRSGFVASLARPGGNVTGVSVMTPELGSKRLELLKEVVPRVTRLAVLWSPAPQRELRVTRAAADKLGLALKLMDVRNADDLARAFAVLEKERPDALTMLFDGLTSGYRGLVGDFAKKHKLPTVFGAREFAEAGGLMSYAPDIADGFHRAATYVDKILKGAKPGDLPIEQPTKFELVINLKTAKALGLTIPQSLLVRADKIIE